MEDRNHVGLGTVRWIASGAISCLVVLLAGCGSQRELVSTPQWVTALPSVPGYYIGVAAVPLAQYPYDAPQRAKELALQYISSQISVRVASHSILETMQQNGLVTQSYASRIESDTEEDLEGHELVDVYLTEDEAWAYYRLSIAKYKAIQAERKSTAIELAAGFFESGMAAREEANVSMALDRFARGLVALERYWGETNSWTNGEGERIALDHALMDGISEVLGGVRLEASVTELELDYGMRFRGQVEITATLNGSPVASLPIVYRYSRGTLPARKELKTSANGTASLDVGNFDPGVQRAEIRVELDVNRVLPDLDRQSPVRNLIEGQLTASLIIPVVLKSPVVYIDANERSLDKPYSGTGLVDELSEAMNKRGIVLTENRSTADLILQLESNTVQGGYGNDFFTAYLEARIIVLTHEGEPVLQQNLPRVKGVQLNWTAASSEAYRKAGKEIKGRFLQTFLEALYE